MPAGWRASKLVKISNVDWHLFGELIEVATGKVLTEQDLELNGQAAEMVPTGGASMGRRFASAAGLALPDYPDAPAAAAGP